MIWVKKIIINVWGCKIVFKDIFRDTVFTLKTCTWNDIFENIFLVNFNQNWAEIFFYGVKLIYALKMQKITFLFKIKIEIKV